MKKNLVAAAVASVLMPALSHADIGGLSDLSFSGFGTAGAVATNTDKAEFATSVLQPNGAKKKADFGVDSLLAGQVNYRMTDSLSFVGQAVANKNADDQFTPHVEWAFAKYAITRDLGVRGGIMPAPILMISDSRLVGFANPWVRPPTAVYSQVALTNFRGVDLLVRHAVGDVNLTAQPYFGKAPTWVPNAGGDHLTAQIDNMAGLNLGAELGGWTARVGYMQAKFTYHTDVLDQLFGGLRGVNAFVPGAAQLADSLDATGKRIRFMSAGAAYEGGNLLFQAEYAKRKSDFFLGDTTSWYTTLGYRHGDFLPFVTLSQVKMDSPSSDSTIPPFGPLVALSGGVNAVLATQNAAQKVVAVGMRYQFAKNADVKVQWDRVRIPQGSTGGFQHPTLDFNGGNVNIYSATVDFVF
jgi:hypothetical protein